MNRRTLLTVATAIVATSLGAGPAAAQSNLDKARQAGQTELVIAGGAGGYLEAVKKHFYDPFTAATGIKIVTVSAPYGEKATRLKAMHEVGKVEWDLVTLSLDFLNPTVTPYLRDLGSCGDVPGVARSGVEGACLRHGVLFEIGGVPYSFSTTAFPAGKPQPKTWADFWDVKTFPGPRALPNAGVPWWPMIAALQADGVPHDKLFPLDIDRAFRKLDEIKPHVTVWWRNGDQSQQVVRNNEVALSMMYSGRALKLKSEGTPIDLAWLGAPIDAVFIGATKDAPHPHAALAFIDFMMTRPDAHAAYANANFYDTSNKEALAQLSPAEQKARATHPDNLRTLVAIDRDWVAANRDKVIERWNKWLAQ
jgi:mannopine transport system substrate-binding protein